MKITTSDSTPNRVIIAGASGLVGSHVVNQLLTHPAIDDVVTVSRRPLTHEHTKLTQIVAPELNFVQANLTPPQSQLGIIALGTTRQQAGSRAALEKVDYELVCQVAQQMKSNGVTRLAVVSSYGANSSSLSHYLRCKGRAEHTISQMGFEQVIFVRPGPLLGYRQIERASELWLQRFMTFGSYLMIGRLKNLIPIAARDVASVMIEALLCYQQKSITTLNSVAMRAIVEQLKYQTK